MTENIFEKNIWVKIYNDFFRLYQNYSNNFVQMGSDRTNLYDKFSYIVGYNPHFFKNIENSQVDSNKKYLPYLSDRYLFERLTMIFVGYYSLVSIYCNLTSNIKNFHCRWVYQNHIFKKTLIFPLITYIIAHKIYYSWDKFEDIFHKELEYVKDIKIQDFFFEKKIIQSKIWHIKKNIFVQKKNEEKEEDVNKNNEFDKNNTIQNLPNDLKIDSKLNIDLLNDQNRMICNEKEKYYIIKLLDELERKKYF